MKLGHLQISSNYNISVPIYIYIDTECNCVKIPVQRSTQYSAQYSSAQYRAGWWSAVCRAQLLGPTPQQSLCDSRNTSTHSALHTAFTHSYSYYRYSEEAIGDHYPGCDLLPPPQCRGRGEDEVGYSPDKLLLHSPRSDRAAAQRRRQPQQFLSSVTAG